jgi:hypothetical protein
VRIGQKIARPAAGRKESVRIEVQLRGHGKLLQMILAGRLPRSLARGLNTRQHELHQEADDGDDHEQLDERHCGAACLVLCIHLHYDSGGSAKLLPCCSTAPPSPVLLSAVFFALGYSLLGIRSTWPAISWRVSCLTRSDKTLRLAS